MPLATTPLQLMAGRLLKDQGPLDKFVSARRAEGMSWQRISDELHAATNGVLDINRETLRTWYPSDRREGAGDLT